MDMTLLTLIDDMASKRGKSTEARKQIDENLKRAYEDALKQEVPDRFLDLIAKLRSSDDRKGGGRQ